MKKIVTKDSDNYKSWCIINSFLYYTIWVKNTRHCWPKINKYVCVYRVDISVRPTIINKKCNLNKLKSR